MNGLSSGIAPVAIVAGMGIAFLAAAVASSRKPLKCLAFCFASAVCFWFPVNVALGRYVVTTDARDCYSRNLSGCFAKVSK
jgi:hypothetical protein